MRRREQEKRELRLHTTAADIVIPDFKEALPCYYNADIHNVSDKDFEALLGYELPYKDNAFSEEITINNSLEDASHTKAGKIINSLLVNMFRAMSKGNASQEKMMVSMSLQIPIRCFISMSMGVFTPEMADGLCLILNGKGTLKGLQKIVGGIGEAVKNIGTLMSSI